MPELISRISRSAELASRSSTIRAIRSPDRIIRPYPYGLSTPAVNTVAAAFAGRQHDDVEVWHAWNYRLSGASGPEGTAAVEARRDGSLERRPEGIVFAERLQVGIGTRQAAVFGIQRDGAFEVRDRLGDLA